MTFTKNEMNDTLQRLAQIIETRKPAAGGDPESSYVARLFAKGDDAILKKIGEEATEAVMAAKFTEKAPNGASNTLATPIQLMTGDSGGW